MGTVVNPVANGIAEMRFFCSVEGCDKSFRRKEHLRRHSYNHTQERSFQCQECDRIFVRKDLLKRHYARHRKGFWFRGSIPEKTNNQLQRQGGLTQSAPSQTTEETTVGADDRIQIPAATSTEPLDHHQNHQNHQHHHHHQHPHPYHHVRSAYRETSANTPSDSSSPNHITMPLHAPLSQLGEELMAAPSPGLYMGGLTPSYIRQASETVSSDKTLLIQNNDLSWLFENSLDPSSLDMCSIGQTNDTEYLRTYYENGGIAPDTASSTGEREHDEVWERIRDDLIKCLFGISNEFHGSAAAVAAVAAASSPLQSCTLANMYPPDVLHSWINQPALLERFFFMYFENYHEHFPILHQPTMMKRPERIPPLLMIAMLTLGTAFAADEYFETSVQLHERLQFLVFSHKDINTPPLWIFQCISLVQAFEKMLSTRSQHDMSSTFHGAMIILLRRKLQLFTSEEDDDADIASDPIKLNSKWHRWIEEESRRRVLLFAFVMDTQHVALFGHRACMSTNEIFCQLPCMENVWSAESAESWYPLYRAYAHKEVVGNSFLGGLKTLLMLKPLNSSTTSHFARIVLLHGLYGIAIQMQQQESLNDMNGQHLKCTDCGAEGLDKRANWKELLIKAISNWSYCLYSQKSMIIEVCRALHHIAHVTVNLTETSILDILMYSGMPLYDRMPSNMDFMRAVRSIREWMSHEKDCTACVKHSLLLMQEIIFSGNNYYSRERELSDDGASSQYCARLDKIAARPWSLVISTLVVWAFYSFLGIERDFTIPESQEKCLSLTEQFFSNRLYAFSQNDPINAFIRTDKESADHIMCVLFTVRNSIKGCRWELMEEAHKCFGVIIEKFSGPGVITD